MNNALAKAIPWSPPALAFAERFAPESEASRDARAEGVELGLTIISQGCASALTLLAKTISARSVVEIGTGTGVSGLALFAGMAPDGILTSIDIEHDHQSVARRAFAAVGVKSQRVRLIGGAALNVLPKLSDGAYDLVLVGADRLEYVEYVAQAVRLLRSGGLLVLDRAALAGRVADENDQDDDVVVVRDALAAVQEHDEFTSAMLATGDGLVIAVKH